MVERVGDIEVYAEPIVLGAGGGVDMLAFVIFGLILAVLVAAAIGFMANSNASKAQAKTARLSDQLATKEYLQSQLATSFARDNADERMSRLERDADRQRVNNKLNTPVTSR